MFAPAHLRLPRRDRAILTGSLVAMAVAAWLALWLWDGSPYRYYLQHDGVGGDGAFGASLAVGATVFTVGWTLMIVAMMLPSSVPLVITFRALVARRARPARLVLLLLIGYLVVWAGFGFAAWAADRAVHAAVAALPWLAEHPQLIIGATLLTAGLWQFSPLRDRCLDECRSPLGFVLNRWRGRSERREALMMGIAHGAFCVGCCWSLMLVMFGVGISSLAAMLVLGGLTAIEKNLPQGRRLSRPLGVVLVLAAVYAVAA
jgi:predicted metal-binding membrane protein